MPAVGSPESPQYGGYTVRDDTGVVITVTTGGTFQDVKHATLVVAGPSNGLTVTGTDGTINVPANALGKYRLSVTGVCLGANSATVKLRPALAGASISAANGGCQAQAIMATTAVQRAIAMSSILNLSAAGNFSLQVTSGSNSDTVTFKELQVFLERVGE